MAGDPLYEPLGRRAAPSPRRNRRPIGLVIGFCAMIAALLAIWAGARQREALDRTTVVSTIVPAAKPQATEPQGAAPPASITAQNTAATGSAKVITMTPSATASSNQVEIQNGVKIVRFNPSGSSSPVSIPVQADAAPLAPAPDPGVSERTPDGLLPRIGPDGRSPGMVYARASTASGARAALLVTGMGVDQMATAETARRLPPDVSFAFAPEVPDAAAQIAETRRLGHEVFLDLSHFAGGDLKRQMARFTGYAGVLLPADNATAMREVKARGLLAVPVAGSDGQGEAPPVLPIDAASGPKLASELDSLGALALHAPALAIVAHAPAALDPLGSAPASLLAKGVTLVPASAVVAAPSVTARTAP